MPDDIVIVDGVRYRPEDAPKDASKAAPAPANKARTPRNKAKRDDEHGDDEPAAAADAG